MTLTEIIKDRIDWLRKALLRLEETLHDQCAQMCIRDDDDDPSACEYCILQSHIRWIYNHINDINGGLRYISSNAPRDNLANLARQFNVSNLICKFKHCSYSVQLVEIDMQNKVKAQRFMGTFRLIIDVLNTTLADAETQLRQQQEVLPPYQPAQDATAGQEGCNVD